MSAAEIAAPPRLRWAPRNQVLPGLVVIAALAGAGTGFLGIAPNRLVSGTPVALWNAAGAWPPAALAVAGVALFALGFAAPQRALHYLGAVVAGSVLAATLAIAGAGAATLAAGAPQDRKSVV